MIFATVGSHPTFRFDRLLQALELLPDDDLVVQHGPGKPPANAREAWPYMTFAEMLEHMERASIVISHAGVGSILCSLQAGHVPFVMPRQARFRETVDDHQVELARALVPTGQILLVETAESLPSRVAEAGGARGAAAAADGSRLAEAVRAELRAP